MDRRSSFSSDSLPTTDPSSGRRRPLIDQCTNEWQNNPKFHDHLHSDLPDTFADEVVLFARRIWALVKAPKFQRLFAVLCVATILSIFLWRNFLSDMIAENRAAWEMLNADSEAKHGGLFGVNRRVQFSGVTHMDTLNSKYLPSNEKSPAGKEKRLIFIGDIHGCMAELEALLAKTKYSPERDHIIAVGDMISKGPQSLEVIDFLVEHGASCVRGNHEDRILLVANDYSGNALKAQISHPGAKEESEAAKQIRMERELAKSLTPEQLDWLNACPVILKVGEIGSHGDIVAVHGGLVPGIALEDQDPMSVMNMRIVNLTTHMPSSLASEEGSVPWADFWNKYQKLRSVPKSIFGAKHSDPNFKHTTVVYGHDAKRGLQIDTYTKGLDSGCVKGGKLSAWVVGDRGKNEIIQVKSRNRLGLSGIAPPIENNKIPVP